MSRGLRLLGLLWAVMTQEVQQVVHYCYLIQTKFYFNIRGFNYEVQIFVKL